MPLALGIGVAVPKAIDCPDAIIPVDPGDYITDDAGTEPLFVDDLKTQPLETTDP